MRHLCGVSGRRVCVKGRRVPPPLIPRRADVQVPSPPSQHARSDCKFGSFNAATCKCACMGEGTPGGYCRDKATGQCSVTC